MKTFDEIYEELQNDNNEELKILWQEAKKEKEKAQKISRTICLIIDVLIGIIFLSSFIKYKTWFLLMPIIIFAVVSNAIIYLIVFLVTDFDEKLNQFDLKYKNTVIKKLMDNFYDNLEYFPQKEMPEYIYEQLEYEHYDIYESDDYFEALINNKNSIQMAEILTKEKKTYTDKDGNEEEREITKFYGLFAKITLDKSINSELKIMPNGYIVFEKDRLNMDSSEFEKCFDVKASNKIVGMQLLTADIMEELVDFENKTKMEFDIYIRNDELYLRFHSGPMFEANNIKKGALDRDTIQKYFYMLNFTYNLSNLLINIVNDTQL